MTMTIDALRAILDANTNTDSTTKKSTLDLPPAALGSTIQNLFQTYLIADGNHLQIALDGPPSQTATDITVTGIGASLPFTGMQVTAVFTPSGDEATIALTASGLDGWYFAQSFPALANTLLARLSLTGGAFTLNSVDGNNGQQGLYFTGNLQLGEQLQFLQWLVGGSSELSLGGQVEVQQQIPVMSLVAPVGSPITFGIFPEISITLSVESTAVTLNTNAPAYARVVLSLVTELTFNFNGQKTPLPISTELNDQPGLLIFDADISQISQVGLSDLGQLVNGAILGGALPGKDMFDPGNYFNFTGLSLSLDPVAKKIASISLTVETLQPWAVIKPDIVEVNQPVTFIFTVSDPLGTKGVSLNIYGQIQLGPKAILDVNATYTYTGTSNFAFSGILETGSDIDITGIVEHFLKTTVDMPQIDLTALELYADPSTGDYEFSAEVQSDWSVQVGVATLALESAWVSVTRSNDGGNASTQAEVKATAQIGPAQVDLDWNPPNAFSLDGLIPTINLSDLANTFSGSFAAPAKDFPDLTFVNSQMHIVITSGTANGTGTVYDFKMSTELDVLGNTTGLGTIDVGFELRKDSTGTGFVVGFMLPDAWSPASLWDELKTIFSWISLKDSALVVSSLKMATASPVNVTVKSLPATVQQGVTFCTTVELSNSLGLLAKLFDGLGGLTMVVLFNPSSPTTSTFIAGIGEPAGKGTIAYQGFSLTFSEGTDSLTVTAQIGATITIGGKRGQPADVLLVEGGATMSLSPASPTAIFSLLMTGSQKAGDNNTNPASEGWNNPFGINPNLTIMGIGFEVTIEESGFTFAFGGEAAFGDPAKNEQVILEVEAEIVDGEDPGALVMSVKSSPSEDNGVTLPQLIGAFTGLQLNWVPLLGDISLKELAFYIVDDPAGFVDPLDPTHKHVYPPGFMINADVIFFGVEAVMDIQVIADKGIKANGNLSKVIDLGNVLIISNADGTKGLNGMIDTTALTGPSTSGQYLSLSGMVSLFNADKISLEAYIKKNAFNFQLYFQVPPLKDFYMDCNINGLDSFAAGAGLEFALDNRTVDLKIGSLDLGTITLPHLDLKADFNLSLGPGAAFSLSLDVSFQFQSVNLGFSFTITESFSDLAQIVEKTFKQIATLGWDLFKKVLGDFDKLFNYIGQNLMELGEDFGKLMNQYYQKTLDEVMQSFKQIGYDAKKFVKTLEEGFEVADKDIAAAMQKAGYELNQIADALANGLDTAAKDAARIFYDLGYAADDITNALTGYFGTAYDDAKAIVDDIFNDADTFCAAHAFAMAIGAPDDDEDALRQLRTDMENMPAGSKGQWYLQLYNQYSARVHQLITTNAIVKAHITHDNGQQIWNQIVASVTSAQSGQPATMPGKDEESAALDILATIQQVDSTLATVIQEVWPDIQSYEGMTYAQFLEAAKAPHPSSDTNQ